MSNSPDPASPSVLFGYRSLLTGEGRWGGGGGGEKEILLLFCFSGPCQGVKVAGERIRHKQLISMHLCKEHARSATTNIENTRNICERAL